MCICVLCEPKSREDKISCGFMISGSVTVIFSYLAVYAYNTGDIGACACCCVIDFFSSVSFVYYAGACLCCCLDKFYKCVAKCCQCIRECCKLFTKDDEYKLIDERADRLKLKKVVVENKNELPDNKKNKDDKKYLIFKNKDLSFQGGLLGEQMPKGDELILNQL